VFLDESGIDANIAKTRGWGLKSKKLFGKISGKRGKRISVVSAVCAGKKLSPYLFEGTCTSDIFEDYLKTVLLKKKSKAKSNCYHG
jgi:hypothetical protein